MTVASATPSADAKWPLPELAKMFERVAPNNLPASQPSPRQQPKPAAPASPRVGGYAFPNGVPARPSSSRVIQRAPTRRPDLLTTGVPLASLEPATIPADAAQQPLEEAAASGWEPPPEEAEAAVDVEKAAAQAAASAAAAAAATAEAAEAADAADAADAAVAAAVAAFVAGPPAAAPAPAPAPAVLPTVPPSPSAAMAADADAGAARRLEIERARGGATAAAAARQLTAVLQHKMGEQAAAHGRARDADGKRHQAELRAVRERCEEHLAQAAERVREARLVARDAYQNIGRVKRLSEANTRLEAQLSAAVERGDDAERRRAEMEASIAPMAEEKARHDEVLDALRAEIEEQRRFTADARAAVDGEKARLQREALEARRKMEKEGDERIAEEKRLRREAEEAAQAEAAAAQAEAAAAVEAAARSEAEATVLRNKLESSSKMVATLQAKIAEMEAVEDLKDTIERQAMQAEQVRAVVASFSAEQDALFQVDTTCVGCLGTLAKPRVLAPCGHTVCGECIASMDRAAAKQVGIFAGEKFCPVCEFPEGEPPEPVEGHPNSMLDNILSRCATRQQHVTSLRADVDAIHAGKYRPG